MRNFELPGRSLAAGKRGMAATSHPTATFAAIEALRDGGNAVDAAVAACAVQCVVEAGSTGIGGDCFALLSRGGSADVVAYNGSGRTPVAATTEWYERHGVENIERHSPHAVTIPGAVEAWARLIKDHGRRPLAAALEPAIELARDGYAISPRVSHDIGKQRDLLRRDQTASRIFLSDGEAPGVGAVAAAARARPDAGGHRSRWPRRLLSGRRSHKTWSPICADLGGLHTDDDFARAKGEYVTPITTEFRGRTVYECPPNGQGIVALMILKILSRFEVRPDPLDIDNLHIEIEATRLAYAARDALLSDPAKVEVPVGYLLSDRLADALAAKIDLSHAIERLPSIRRARAQGHRLHRGRRRGAQRRKLHQFALRPLRQRTRESEVGRALP